MGIARFYRRTRIPRDRAVVRAMRNGWEAVIARKDEDQADSPILTKIKRMSYRRCVPPRVVVRDTVPVRTVRSEQAFPTTV